MEINWREEKIHDSYLYISFCAARNLIRAAFPGIIKNHLVKSKWNKGKIEMTVDWKPIFLNPAVQSYLIKYTGEEPIGFCSGYDTINRRNVLFFADSHACILEFPPKRIELCCIAKVVATEQPMPENLNYIYERYYANKNNS